jgi:hypothetical protein
VVGFARTPIACSLFLGLLLGACVKSRTFECGELSCPEGSICADRANGGSCVSAALATACSGKADGEVCALSELGNGRCQSGLCITGTCGDGKKTGGEDCDGADLGGKTCIDYHATDAAGLACTADCTIDVSGCTGACGDGHKGTAEECDGDDFGGQTCTDFSPPGTTNKFYRGGALLCTQDCKVNLANCIGGWCGDGTKQFFEDCDRADFAGATCASLGHPGAATAVTPLACDLTTCTFTEDSCSCGLDGLCPPATPTCVNNGGTYSCSK